MAAKTTTFFFLLFFSLNLQCSSSDNWIRAGYWCSWTTLPMSEINSALFTHLMCAFAGINSSTYHILINSNYEQSFSNFTNTVKRKNPSVKTLLSIMGGMQNTEIFSSMINQSSSRQSFIESSIETARLYGFDGLLLAAVMPGNSISMTNLGTLLEDWRAAVASESRNSGKSELLLVMSGYNRLLSYPVESMKKSLDWVNVIAFDYYLPTRHNFTGPHSALYDSSSSSSWLNVNNSVQEWLNRGFLATKLVLCMPYHGYAWKLVNTNDNAVGAPASGPTLTRDGSVGYKVIKAHIRNYGYGAASVYNGTFGVNFFTIGQTWINFDSVEAIRAKVSFAKEKGLLGYSMFQLAYDDNWELSTAAKDQGGKDQKNERRLLIIILITVAMAILLIGTIVCYLKRKFILKSRMKNTASDTENLSCNGHNLLVLSFTTIREATDNFASGNKIGEGGYGPVYKGVLSDGQPIAVKRLSMSSKQGDLEFQNEVLFVAKLQHRNLVRLLGFCLEPKERILGFKLRKERKERILVYEFLPNSSLDHFISDPIKREILQWEKRYKIIEGIARGLLYLHEDSRLKIIHRDLKTSNVLLDSELNPKITDFGMARLFQTDQIQSITSGLAGTFGYMAPEYVKEGRISMKSDVYSFGTIVLEIMCGQKISSFGTEEETEGLLIYAWKNWNDGTTSNVIDPTLRDGSTDEMKKCIHIGLLCVQESASDRPTMASVVAMLISENVTLPPPSKPGFFTQNSVVVEASSSQEYYSGSTRSDQLKNEVVPLSRNDVSMITELLPR